MFYFYLYEMILFDYFFYNGLVQSTTNQLTCFSRIIASATHFEQLDLTGGHYLGDFSPGFFSVDRKNWKNPEVPLALLHNTKSCLVGLKLWGNSAAKKGGPPKNEGNTWDL